MKSKKALFMLAPILSFALLAGGCSLTRVSVTSIEKTASYGTEDVYTVSYSDGTSSSFTVKNGKDVTVQDLFNRYKEEYGDELTYDEFLQKYLTVTDDSSIAVKTGLLSSFRVQASNSNTSQQGSAVLYAVNESKNEAYILTNYHVAYISGNYYGGIASKLACSVYGSEQTALSCEYVGGSASSDIALLKTNLSGIKSINPDVKPVTLGESYSVGDTVYAIGNTEGEGISATKGIVSVDSEDVTMSTDGTRRTHRVMRIDAAIYHGNSGGGLFNTKGELIGITNGGNETDQNVNYAIPLSIVKGTADNILYYDSDADTSTSGAYKIALGFNATSKNARYVYNETSGAAYIEEDVVITSVNAFSIASGLSLRADDVVTGIEVNGTLHSVKRSYQIYDVLLTVRAGDTIKIAYTRGSNQNVTSAHTVKSGELSKIE